MNEYWRKKASARLVRIDRISDWRMIAIEYPEKVAEPIAEKFKAERRARLKRSRAKHSIGNAHRPKPEWH